jgi:hypothetical protein
MRTELNSTQQFARSPEFSILDECPRPIGRDNATSGKREGGLYAMKVTDAKKNHSESKAFIEPIVGLWAIFPIKGSHQ